MGLCAAEWPASIHLRSRPVFPLDKAVPGRMPTVRSVSSPDCDARCCAPLLRSESSDARLSSDVLFERKRSRRGGKDDAALGNFVTHCLVVVKKSVAFGWRSQFSLFLMEVLVPLLLAEHKPDLKKKKPCSSLFILARSLSYRPLM